MKPTIEIQDDILQCMDEDNLVKEWHKIESQEFEYIPKEPGDFVKVECRMSNLKDDHDLNYLFVQYQSIDSDNEPVDNFSLTYKLKEGVTIDLETLWSQILYYSNLDYKSIRDFLNFHIEYLILKAHAEKN